LSTDYYFAKKETGNLMHKFRLVIEAGGNTLSINLGDTNENIECDRNIGRKNTRRDHHWPTTGRNEAE
jgi:hypothetical protein